MSKNPSQVSHRKYGPEGRNHSIQSLNELCIIRRSQEILVQILQQKNTNSLSRPMVTIDCPLEQVGSSDCHHRTARQNKQGHQSVRYFLSDRCHCSIDCHVNSIGFSLYQVYQTMGYIFVIILYQVYWTMGYIFVIILQ